MPAGPVKVPRWRRWSSRRALFQVSPVLVSMIQISSSASHLSARPPDPDVVSAGLLAAVGCRPRSEGWPGAAPVVFDPGESVRSMLAGATAYTGIAKRRRDLSPAERPRFGLGRHLGASTPVALIRDVIFAEDLGQVRTTTARPSAHPGHATGDHAWRPHRIHTVPSHATATL